MRFRSILFLICFQFIFAYVVLTLMQCNEDNSLGDRNRQNKVKQQHQQQYRSNVADQDYLFEKWKASAAEVKRLVLLLKGKARGDGPPPRKPYPDIINWEQHSPFCSSEGITVASYNLWNINDPWYRRRMEIVALFKRLNLDIVGMQEVRYSADENQAEQIARELGWPHHFVYSKVQLENSGKEEGLAIVSKHPILSHEYIPITASQPGLKTRGLLRADINVTAIGKVQFYVTHLGIEDIEQCHSVGFILQQLNVDYNSMVPQIIVGDFNAYFDFEWPMDFLTRDTQSLFSSSFLMNELGACSDHFKSYLPEKQVGNPILRDVWEQIYPSKDNIRLKNLELEPNMPGHTFPNCRDVDIQDASRPDRILHRGNQLVECDIALFGDEPLPRHADDGKLLHYPSDHRGVVARLTLDKFQTTLTDLASKQKAIQTWK